MNSRNIGYLLSAFVVNKIDDDCAASVDSQKLISMGLAYGDVIMYKQTFVSNESVPSYKQRCEELKQSLKRSRTNDKIIEEKKILKVSIGLKCKEMSGVSKALKYTLKNNKSYADEIPTNILYDDLHKRIRDHYMVSNARSTYIGLYDGSSIESMTMDQVYMRQKSKKKSLALYLYYPKSFGDLEFKRMVDAMPNTSSDDECDQPSLPEVEAASFTEPPEQINEIER